MSKTEQFIHDHHILIIFVMLVIPLCYFAYKDFQHNAQDKAAEQINQRLDTLSKAFYKQAEQLNTISRELKFDSSARAEVQQHEVNITVRQEQTKQKVNEIQNTPVTNPRISAVRNFADSLADNP